MNGDFTFGSTTNGAELGYQCVRIVQDKRAKFRGEPQSNTWLVFICCKKRTALRFMFFWSCFLSGRPKMPSCEPFCGTSDAQDC
ncbi:hypothetical protein M378DRAFT_352753 [Amanita muscaria Koide BX008]|uniref:Uncharacterized protein n=1 Tax=Amanita muscaria (strain Koide BX008) TaxID=946122 RepID=A0A0C2STZ0_AMAMK|nr:hypothetical protein M378DRAFT_352753 [Amanita muscaria Koide BX008]